MINERKIKRLYFYFKYVYKYLFFFLNILQISTLNDWRVTDINASRPVVPSPDPDNGWLIITSYEVEYHSPFWLAPKIYTGNRLSSYGSNLTYAVSWIVMRGDTSGKPTTEPNIVLVVNIIYIFVTISHKTVY